MTTNILARNEIGRDPEGQWWLFSPAGHRLMTSPREWQQVSPQVRGIEMHVLLRNPESGEWGWFAWGVAVKNVEPMELRR